MEMPISCQGTGVDHMLGDPPIPPLPTFPRCSAADVGHGHASAAGMLTITNGSLLASKM